MKKLRRTGIVLLILLLGIAGWQAYSYIERATRPEPAVVYTTCSPSLINSVAGWISKATNNRCNILQDYGTLWACSEDGSRKWILERYTVFNSVANPISPYFVYLPTDDGSGCVFIDNLANTTQPYPPTDLPCIDYDVRTGTKSSLNMTIPLAYMPLQFSGMSVPLVLDMDQTSGSPAIYRWEGIDNGFQPVLGNKLAELEKNGYSFGFISGCLQSDLLCVSATAIDTSLPRKPNDVCDTYLFFFDIDSGETVSRWMIPSVCAEPEFVPYPVKEYPKPSKPVYRVDTTLSVIRPPGADRTAVLSSVYRITDIDDPLKSVKESSTIFKFNLVNGNTVPIDLPKEYADDENNGDMSGNPAVAKNKLTVEYICYDPKYEISYLTFSDEKNGMNSYGFRSDDTWTEPLPDILQSYRAGPARDGAIWSVGLQLTPAGFGPITLFRYDPVTGESKAITTADDVSICFTLN